MRRYIVAVVSHFKMLLTYYCDAQKQSPREFAKFVRKQLCRTSFLAKLQVFIKILIQDINLY